MKKQKGKLAKRKVPNEEILYERIALRRGFKQVARHQRLRQNESYHGWNQAGVNLVVNQMLSDLENQ